MTSVIKVDIPENSYQIIVAPGSLDQLGPQMASLNLGKKTLLVSNPIIFKLYGERAIALYKMLVLMWFIIISHLESDIKH